MSIDSASQFDKKYSYVKTLIFIFPIILFPIFLGIKVIYPSTYTLIIQEDSPIEYLQAFFYFISSIVSLFISFKFLKNKLLLLGVLFIVLALGLFFITMEEISWGQRIFNIANPKYFSENNTQNEISIHNLKPIQRYLHMFYILTGAYGAFSWLFILRKKIKCYDILNYIVSDWFVSSSFFFVFFIYTLVDYISIPYPGGFLLFRDQEPCELLLSLGFLFFTINNYLKLRICLTREKTELNKY